MSKTRSRARRAIVGIGCLVVAAWGVVVIGGMPMGLNSAWRRFCVAADEARAQFHSVRAAGGVSPVEAVPSAVGAWFFHDLAFAAWQASPATLEPVLGWLERAAGLGLDDGATPSGEPSEAALTRLEFVDALDAHLQASEPAERIERSLHVAHYGVVALRRASTLVDQMVAALCIERALDRIDATVAGGGESDAPLWSECAQRLARIEAAIPSIGVLAAGFELGARSEAIAQGSIVGKSWSDSIVAMLQRPVLVARFGEIERARDAIAATAEVPWADACQRVAKIRGSSARHGAGTSVALGLSFFDPYAGGVHGADLPRMQRRLLTRLRLSRLRAHFSAHDELLELADPFGTVLRADARRGEASSAEAGLRVVL